MRRELDEEIEGSRAVDGVKRVRGVDQCGFERRNLMQCGTGLELDAEYDPQIIAVD